MPPFHLMYKVFVVGLFFCVSAHGQNGNIGTNMCYLKTLIRSAPLSARAEYFYDDKKRLTKQVITNGSVVTNIAYCYKKDSMEYISTSSDDHYTEIAKYHLNELGFADNGLITRKFKSDSIGRENEYSFEYDNEGHLIRKVIFKNAQYNHEENYFWESGNLVKEVNRRDTIYYEFDTKVETFREGGMILFGRPNKNLKKSIEYKVIDGKTHRGYDKENFSYDYDDKGYVTKKYTNFISNSDPKRSETFVTEYLYECF